METKSWYTSTTIQGGIITLLMLGVAVFGLDLDKGIVTELITALAELAGIIMVIVGRLKATTKLGI